MREYRCGWLKLATTILIILIMIILSGTIVGWCPYSVSIQRAIGFWSQSVLWLSLSMSFTTFIRNLHKRYAALNSLLRWAVSIFFFLQCGKDIKVFLSSFLRWIDVEINFWTGMSWKFRSTLLKMMRSMLSSSLDVNMPF